MSNGAMMTSYYDALIAKWSSLSGTTDEKLAAVNALTVDGPRQDVPVSAVEGYLGLRGLLTEIEDWLAANPTPSAARTCAKELLRTINSPHVASFAMSNPTTYATVQGMLGALVANPPALLTAQHEADLLAMAESKTLWRAANGYQSDLCLGDAVAAGLV